MRLVRFAAGGAPEIGVLLGDRGIVSLTRREQSLPTELPALIEEWDAFRPRCEAVLAPSGFDHVDYRLDEVTLLAPVRRPGKILGIGLNYADHAAESGLERPSEQMWFMKGVTCAAGPADPIALPRVSEQLDYEGELVVVIGRRCRYVDTDDEARAAIFGYCVGNDVSVRDYQFKTSQFLLGKSFDGHAPHGPWITTADEVDAGHLDITTTVNGEVRQSSNTHNLMFDPVAQVRYLSQVMTLEPGDLLFTGTPAGVGAGHKPPLWLREGDIVEVMIAGLGKISNVVVRD